MGNTQYPWKEFPLLTVFPLPQCPYYFYKSILKQIFRKTIVLYNKNNVGKDPGFVPVDENFQTPFVALDVSADEFLVT
jgi:hypothetical protein